MNRKLLAAVAVVPVLLLSVGGCSANGSGAGVRISKAEAIQAIRDEVYGGADVSSATVQEIMDANCGIMSAAKKAGLTYEDALELSWQGIPADMRDPATLFSINSNALWSTCPGLLGWMMESSGSR